MTLVILGVLIVCAFLGCTMWIVTGYILGRWRGSFIIFVLAACPGALSTLSVLPSRPSVPLQYEIGGHGALGTPWGMVALVAVFALFGWMALVMLVDIVRVGDRFWQVYDHFWYATALLTAIFFVADSTARRQAQSIEHNSHSLQRASAYLFAQASDYAAWCEAHGLGQRISCEWAAAAQQRLLDLSATDAVHHVALGPKSVSEFYGSAALPAPDDEIETIRRELYAYNWERCPMHETPRGDWAFAPATSKCLRTPPEYCVEPPDPLAGIDAFKQTSTPAVLDANCIVPSIVAYRITEEHLLQLGAETKELSPYFRWLYYLAAATMLGGRIASATVKLAAMQSRPVDETRRSVQLMAAVFHILLWLVRAYTSAVLRTSRVMFAGVVRGVRALARRLG